MSVAMRSTALIIPAAALMMACAVAPRPALTPSAFASADSVASTTLADGVTYTFVHDARGPWAIHVLEVDVRRCEPVLQTRKPGTTLHERATTSALAGNAIAAINADFFMLPRGTPVGAHVADAVPLTGPVDRPVFGTGPAGWSIGTARIRGHVHAGSDSVSVSQVNRAPHATPAYRGTRDGVTLFTSWIGDSVPADSAALRITVQLLHGNEAAGRGIVAARAESAVATSALPAGSVVLVAHGPDRDWARRRTVGDTVAWSIAVVTEQPLTEVVGGFPELLRDGRSVLAGQTIAASFGDTRHPRTAIGWTDDDRLLLVVIDGRQPDWSLGMSLAELAWLFQSLGATHALNLDGGGSTAMILAGRVVNRTSDREGERAVGNALALARCR